MIPLHSTPAYLFFDTPFLAWLECLGSVVSIGHTSFLSTIAVEPEHSGSLFDTVTFTANAAVGNSPKALKEQGGASGQSQITLGLMAGVTRLDSPGPCVCLPYR